MQPLDPISFPLNGVSLIEASAGTGKTYTIVNLYLRLLLGHGCSPLDVEQILVVTFTKAATAELKARIRQKLAQTYIDFIQGQSNDEVVTELIHASENVQKDCHRLAMSIRQMDEAAVFTIHSFCQRTLSEHAFESGSSYEQTLILDESEWLKLAVEDYWRKYLVPHDAPTQQFLNQIWDNPAVLTRSLRPLLHRTIEVDNEVDLQTCLETFQGYRDQVQAVKVWWLQKDVSRKMLDMGFKKNTKLGKPAVYHEMTAYCQSDSLTPPIDKQGWMRFSPDSLTKSLPKGGSFDPIADLDFEQFVVLQQSYEQSLQQLQSGFSAHALKQVKANLDDHKARLQLLSPDDLLASLEQALVSKQGNVLANAIRERYPVVLIDEFQDTDPSQFALFNHVYIQAPATVPATMIMIGDPKQAIYAFRGADIFTYIQAKRLLPVESQFTLATNWRSQPKLVEAINGVFETSKSGFMFEQDIPFISVNAARSEKPLVCNEQRVPSLEFQVLGGQIEAPLPWSEASQKLAEHTAQQIADFVVSGMIGTDEVTAGDCCVLVRDRDEANLMKQALARRNLASVFLIRKSVFATQTAADLYLLLTAIANPANERAVKAALATELLALSAIELDQLISDEFAWQELVDQCFYWQQTWQHRGIMLMLSKVCEHFALFTRLVEHYEDGTRRVTDFRHLCELLQQQGLETPSESQLLHWFAELINDPDHDHEGQQIRLETDANLVQIVTMHASKGLEFPLVFIPFACRFRAAKTALYHDDQQTLRVDFSGQGSTLEMAEYERLAEDIRLLYVALTRGVYYCSVGVWDPAQANRKNVSVLFQSAFGKLISHEGMSQSVQGLLTHLKSLASQLDIGWINADDPALTPVPLREFEQHADLCAAKLSNPVNKDWHLTSYSAISRQQSHSHSEMPGRDEGISAPSSEPVSEPGEEDLLNQFTFTKGAQAGSFLHGVLENIEFTHPDNLESVVEQQGKWFGIDEKWYPMVSQWMEKLLKVEIHNHGTSLSLASLSAHQRLAEMEFHLPLEHVQAKAFNQLINRFSPQANRNYEFEQLNGMLKGYIDLTFEYQGKFYVADYKSNHLGNTLSDYHQAGLLEAMESHDYQLQAILYVLALHRWLKVNLADYSYQQHIGGAYYLFLRGMDSSASGAGVYHHLPDEKLIDSLDKLFAGHEITAGDNQSDNAGEQLDLW